MWSLEVDSLGKPCDQALSTVTTVYTKLSMGDQSRKAQKTPCPVVWVTRAPFPISEHTSAAVFCFRFNK